MKASCDSFSMAPNNAVFTRIVPSGRAAALMLESSITKKRNSSINAAALPDGTILVNTALLGAIENESQLAFILSHEISHVLQVHYWREVHETRQQRDRKSVV